MQLTINNKERAGQLQTYQTCDGVDFAINSKEINEIENKQGPITTLSRKLYDIFLERPCTYTKFYFAGFAYSQVVIMVLHTISQHVRVYVVLTLFQMKY